MNDRSRPKAAPETLAKASGTSLPRQAAIPAQIRRRRAASRRLPCLADGRRDTLDKPRTVRVVTVRIIGSRASTAEFAGPGVILDAFRVLGVRYMRSRFGAAWWCPAIHAGDVMAYLETRGVRVDAVL